ncbi:hypothetical protein ABK040_008615 [Willaertia magna]
MDKSSQGKKRLTNEYLEVEEEEETEELLSSGESEVEEDENKNKTNNNNMDGNKRLRMWKNKNNNTNNNNNLNENSQTNSEKSVFIVKTGDFRNETSICDMLDDCNTNEYGKRYNVIIDQSVLTGILDHAYSDHNNEILGLLGGIYEEKTNTVYVKHYMATIRSLENIAIDGVECSPNEFIKAQEVFQKLNLIFIGWYHSHPRIAPFPSMKDLQMQLEMQTQAPYSFGLICSAYYNEGNLFRCSDKHSFYFNCFRTARNSNSDDLIALKVMYQVVKNNSLRSEIQNEMLNVLKNNFHENNERYKKIIQPFESSLNSNKANQLYIMSQYQNYLFSFWKNSINERTLALNQDIENLRKRNEYLKKQIMLKSKDKNIENNNDKKNSKRNDNDMILFLNNNVYNFTILNTLNSHQLDTKAIIEEERQYQLDELEDEQKSTNSNLDALFSHIEQFSFPTPATHSFNYSDHCYNHYEKFIDEGITYEKGDILIIEMTTSNEQQQKTTITQIVKLIDIIIMDEKDCKTSEERKTHTFLKFLNFFTINTIKDLNPTLYKEYLQDGGEDELILCTIESNWSHFPLIKAKAMVLAYENYITKKFSADNFDFSQTSNNNNENINTLYYARFSINENPPKELFEININHLTPMNNTMNGNNNGNRK